jgi:hypothetical protein
LLGLTLGPSFLADTYVLVDGDRITGKTLLAGTKTFRVKSAYGPLVIPRAKVERILHDDGREEVVNAPDAPPAPPPTVHIVLVITGKSFWYAWDPHAPGVDATLRLDVRMDEEPLVTYVDSRNDPEDLPGATVNTFSFGADSVSVKAAGGVTAAAPEARPGRIVLKLELPAESAGRHRLRIAYQLDDGTAAQPAWRDAVATMTDAELSEAAPSFLEIHQDAGRMEYSGLMKHRMKNVETFRLDVRPEPAE